MLLEGLARRTGCANGEGITEPKPQMGDWQKGPVECVEQVVGGYGLLDNSFHHFTDD